MKPIWRIATLSLLALLLAIPSGCSHRGSPPQPVREGHAPVVRVRIFENQREVMLTASAAPTVYTTADTTPKRLNFNSTSAIPLRFDSAGHWQMGNANLGRGELVISPAGDGTLLINGQAFRGRFRMVPTTGGFDVINDIDVESYLVAVLPRELLRNWHVEAYKAQAIAARTYAIYVARTTSPGRSFDLDADQRSQVYGGMAAETEKSRQAVEATRGIVLGYGRPGEERIFKAYFSACCGGVSLSAADAFNETHHPALAERNNHSLCNAAPRFNWGPIVIDKRELTRRIRLWGERRNRPERQIGVIQQIEVQALNQHGRPTRFRIVDAEGKRYSLGPEEMRWAVNTDASSGTTLYSSFFKTINEPDAIRFVDGHGHGHGVGLCQWCAQRRAELNTRHEDIVLAAYPNAILVRAY